MGPPNFRRQGLVGRDAELGAFDILLDAMAVGSSSVGVLLGEPGIGKTALIGEVVKRSRARGYATFSGRASELERHVPFAVFVDALDAAAGSMSPEQRERMRGERAVLAGSVFPTLRDVTDEAKRDPRPDDDALVLQALHALMKALADGRPVVLALDDLHWADPASIDLVCRLLHRGLTDHSLLLLASRPAQSEPRVRAAFAEAELHGNAERIELGPLSAADSEKLLSGKVDHREAQRLFRESGGNPFYLEQLAGALRRGENLSAEQSAPLEPSLPATVSAAIRSELDGLSSCARLLLQGASVAGDPFDIDLAARTAGISEHEAPGATDELVARDLIRPDEPAPRFRFRHPIVRRAVYETAGPGWRLQAHRRARATLAERGAPPTVLAPHIERSASVGDHQAADLLARAGKALISQAPASAARWLEAALRLAPASEGNTEHYLELMTERAMALGWAGRLVESRKELRRFLESAPPELSELRLQAISLCARVDQAMGVPADGRKLLLDEFERLGDRGGRAGSVLSNELAISTYYEADWHAVKRWTAATMAADCPRVVRVSSLALLAQAEFSLGDLEAAKTAVSEAAELFDGLHAEELDPNTAVWLGDAEIGCERFGDALRHTDRAIAIFGTGRRSWAVPLHDVRSVCLVFTGRVSELAANAELAFEAALLTSSDLFLSTALAIRSWASLFVGNVRAAVRLGERSVELATSAVGWNDFYVSSQFAGVLLEAGDPARCREVMMRPDGEPRLPPALLVRGSHYEILVRAEIALGNLERAEGLALSACQATERLRTGIWLAYARRALAWVLLARGRTQAAIAEATAACEHAEAVSAPIEAARSKMLAGKALAANGDRAAAIEALVSAHETLYDCGDLLHRDQVARELRGLGRAVRRVSNDAGDERSVLGLSRREFEVMELVAAGKRNREIAEDLVLSVRTVERHLSRIFEKLGVHSRTAASSIFERMRGGVGA
jgi:ATP/maltotriose-dependent transcriptional regulator MalT